MSRVGISKMKTTKQIVSFILITVMTAVALSGCSGGNSSSNTPESTQERSYRDAIKMAGNSSDFVALTQAIVAFAEFGDYEDSREYLSDCFKSIIDLSSSITNDEIYETAKSAYRNGCFNEAAALFQMLPEGYDAQVAHYRAASSAFANFTNGNYDTAAQDILFFSEIVSYDYPDEFANDSRSAFRYIEDTPDYLSYQGASRPHVEPHFHDFYYNCIVAYFNRVIERGDRLAGLSSFPAQSGSRLNSNWDKFYLERVAEVEAKIEQLGIWDYYIKTDNTTSPVDVTGVGLYVAVSDASGRHRGDPDFSRSPGSPIYELMNVIPASYLARAPEEIRYIVAVTDVSHTFYGTYRSGGTSISGFSTNALVTVKDTVTGTILYSGRISGNPPYTTTSTNDVYASVSFSNPRSDDTFRMSDMMSVLSRVFPMLSDAYLS